ncbi:hypothetical protein FOA52_011704 [Chlamydomonas sp. UWO 241]|nr:hypothetical protein FOA52_011704 [Chlamydomonas sp. UWO 241]
MTKTVKPKTTTLKATTKTVKTQTNTDKTKTTTLKTTHALTSCVHVRQPRHGPGSAVHMHVSACSHSSSGGASVG